VSRDAAAAAHLGRARAAAVSSPARRWLAGIARPLRRAARGTVGSSWLAVEPDVIVVDQDSVGAVEQRWLVGAIEAKLGEYKQSRRAPRRSMTSSFGGHNIV